jgi:UDP-N-acetylmuramate--alanine ligase
MLGDHNIRNALAAISIGLELQIEPDTIRAGIAAFEGVKRRFTKTGEAGGISVIDDYGHHPVEISAVLRAGRQATDGAVIAVMQPHRYSRLNDLFEEFCTCFNDADKVVVADVFTAGEDPIPGADRDALAEGLRAHGHRNVKTLDKPEDLPAMIADLAGPGDIVICLGAGNITQWANALPDQLKEVLGDTT